MFSRRHPRTRAQKFRESVWPSMGFYRLAMYYQHKMGRLKATPYAIAVGFASGLAVAFTPFLGFHLMIGGIITWILGGSLIAMVLGSVIGGNFWTYPFIFVGTYKLGKLMLGEKPRAQVPVHFTWHFMLDHINEYLLPMLVGCLPFFVLSWGISFTVVRRVMTGYRDARLKKIRKT